MWAPLDTAALSQEDIMAATENSANPERLLSGGVYAVLGMDIVSFSTLHDDDQIRAIRKLMSWISEALAFHSVLEGDYRWSPAGDGGYLSFTSIPACGKAIDVAFAILEKLQRPDWVPRSGEKTCIRAALHSGTVQEGQGLGRETNMWGMGINTAARILSLAATSQLLVSRQYFDTYIKERREEDFEVGKVHSHTVKHGAKVEVMNISRAGLGLDNRKASAKRWRYIGALWRKTIEEYSWLARDTMVSGDSIAAIAAAKFLLLLGERERVRKLCDEIGRSHLDHGPVTHRLFGQMPPDLLYRVIEKMRPRVLKTNEVLCELGAPAIGCFFPVSGTLVVEVPGSSEPIPIQEGQIVGEFSLWITNLKRTARIRSLDEGLVLEMQNKDFTEILEASPDVANIVYSIVRGRVTENILRSNVLFPGLTVALQDNLTVIPTVCEKHAPGAQLSLEQVAYVVFSGAVSIQAEGSSPLDISCEGRIGFERVVGIVSGIGSSPDGRVATVREEAVTVRIDHKTLTDLQARFSSIENAWNALHGQRLGELRKVRS
jgi:class 3 adenylate cyclase